MNPFGYVNSLYTYARDVAEHLERGRDVVALIGPYDGNELVEQVNLIRKRDSKVQRCLSSCELSSGEYWGLTLMSRLEEPLSTLRGRCKEMGLTLLEAPRNLSCDEISGYGLALSLDSSISEKGRSEVYRATVLRLASGICGGSVSCYRSIVEEYLRREEQGRAFGNPYDLASEYGRARARRMVEEHTYGKDEMDSFLEWLVSLAMGAELSAAEIQATYLWAWSLGFCWRESGTWCIDWSVIMHAIDLPKSSPLVDRGGVNSLMNALRVRRVGSAETSAMMPVLERYCALAASRYICESMRREESWGEAAALNRATQIGDVRLFQTEHPSKWPQYVNDSVSMLDVSLLRNRLCHLNPMDITPRMLTTFQRVIDVLTMREDKRYTQDYSCVFV